MPRYAIMVALVLALLAGCAPQQSGSSGARSDAAPVLAAPPVKDVHVIERTTSSPVEPAIPPWENNLMSRAILDATRPFEWIDKFPAVVDVTPDLRAQTVERWGQILQ